MAGSTRKLLIPAALVLGLGACGASPGVPSSYERSVSSDNRWSVGAHNPEYASLNDCDHDPSVETAVVSADQPSSKLGLRLVEGATEDDALRIAKCLESALSAGKIWVSEPA